MFAFSSDNKLNILLGIGGSGPTKRTPANKFIEFIKLTLNEYDCKFFLATGQEEEEQKILKEIISSCKDKCVSLDKLSILEILPIIKNSKPQSKLQINFNSIFIINV